MKHTFLNKKNILFFIWLLAGTPSFSQFSDRSLKDPTTNEDYIEAKKAADAHYARENYKFALPILLKLYKSNPEDLTLNYRLGITYLNTTYKSLAIGYFEKAKGLDKRKVHPDLGFYLAQAYQSHHEFDKAISEYNAYKNSLNMKHDFDVELGNEINRLVEQCNTGKKLYAAPIKVRVEHLSSKINSPYGEKNPLISFDGNTLYFSSGRPMTTGLQLDPKTEQYYEDIYFSERIKGVWTPARQLTNSVNTNGNDSPLSITADGKRMYLCSSKNESGSVYYTDKKDSLWGPAVPMDKHINEVDYETGACISYDGKTFYFSSDMEGGYGGDDLYKCELQAGNTWGPAINLGQTINSQFDEDDPFILKDGKTLYFSSQGHNTMGGYDIFVSKYDDRLRDWEIPSNIGYPINSSEDEVSISWSGDGKTGYFSEENEDGFGNEDIYKISFDKISEEGIAKSTVASNPVKLLKSSESKAITKAYVEKTYAVQPKVGDVLKEQVHFAFNESHNITEYSKSKIASVIDLLHKYPNLIIEIEGFTDQTDNQEYNLQVSKGRAEAVYNYMIKAGVNKERIRVKINKEAQVHAGVTKGTDADIRNRRVEFKVISINGIVKSE